MMNCMSADDVVCGNLKKKMCRPYEYCNVANGTYWCGCKFGKHGAIHCKPGEVRYLVGDRTIVGNKRRPGPPKNGSVDGRIHMWESNVRERLTGQGIPGT